MGRPTKTDMGFLLEIFPVRKSITIEQARMFLDGLKEKLSFDKAAENAKIKPTTAQALLNELKKAAKNNMSLEQYFTQGRPFKAGSKVVAK